MVLSLGSNQLPDEPTKRSALSAIYEQKPLSYFANARHDIIALLPTGPQSAILELGCGSGGTGRAALAAGKAGRYVGIELSAPVAKVAAEAFNEVLVGDVQELDLTHLSGQFDALIISEVLEHLTDPWTTVARMVACLKPGGMIFASSPNIAHWQVIRNLMLGRFRYRESGSMDRTHLRWFTPESFRALFEDAGVRIQSLNAVAPKRWKAELFNGLTGGRFRHLFIAQMMVVGIAPGDQA